MRETLEKPVAYKSPLYEMTQTTPTCLWNDSATLSELTYSIEHGAVGATCNPVIMLDVLKKEAHLWNDRIRALAREMPMVTEDEIGWRLVEEVSAQRAELLRPAFAQYQGRNGRLSIQTDPHYYRNPAALLEQAVRFDALAPNMIVKIPAVSAGITAIEEATYLSVYLERAARMQIRARVFGPLTPVDDALAREAHDYLLQPSIVNSTFDYWCRQTRGAPPPLSVA